RLHAGGGRVGIRPRWVCACERGRGSRQTHHGTPLDSPRLSGYSVRTVPRGRADAKLPPDVRWERRSIAGYSDATRATRDRRGNGHCCGACAWSRLVRERTACRVCRDCSFPLSSLPRAIRRLLAVPFPVGSLHNGRRGASHGGTFRWAEQSTARPRSAVMSTSPVGDAWALRLVHDGAPRARGAPVPATGFSQPPGSNDPVLA
ncbi:MAG: hypothetical protein K0Q71_4252, partial [Thermomicrobiales bacterium]|nr:hypothetical protein [Thermomicrobiales bacterium]